MTRRLHFYLTFALLPWRSIVAARFFYTCEFQRALVAWIEGDPKLQRRLGWGNER